MEKMDVAIAVAGAVVLAVAITGSALQGGTGGSAPGGLFEFPIREADLGAQSVASNGPGSVELTFDVATSNLTTLTFTAAVSGPAGQAPPSVRLTATSPEGEEFQSEGATLEIPFREAPAPTTGALPSPVTNGTGAWRVVVDMSSAVPVPVPYSGTVSGRVAYYEAAAASGVSDRAR